MNIEAERRKRIARMLKEGMNEDQIKASLGPTKEAAARLPQPEAPREDSLFENSPIYGLPFGIGDNPLVANKIREGVDRLMGTLGAPAAGIAEAAKTGNPLRAISGTLDNVGSRMTEQESLSEALDRPSDTWGQMAGNFGLDVLADPTTYVGGTGLLRAIAKRAGRGAVAGGARSLGKQAAVGTAAAGATALGARMNPEEAGTMALPLGAVAGTLSPKKIPDGFYSVLEREVARLGPKATPSIRIAQALKKQPIKADEWNDVGMDAILSERSTWNPQELLQEIQNRRPSIQRAEGTRDYKKYSTASNALDEPYEAVPVKQPGYNSGIPEGSSNHFGNDVVSHYRTDEFDPFKYEKAHGVNDYHLSKHMLDTGAVNENEFDELMEHTIKKYGNIPDRSKDFVLNEVQSDVHQAGRRYGVRGPKDANKLKLIGEAAERNIIDKMPTRSRVLHQLQKKTERKLASANSRLGEYEYAKQRKEGDDLEWGWFPEDVNKPVHYSPPNPKWLKLRGEIRNRRQEAQMPKPRTGEYKDFGINAPYRADISGAKDDLLDRLNAQAAILESKPNPGAAMSDSWDLFGLKSSLKDAVESGADRYGIVTGDTVDTILGEGGNIGNNPGRSKFYDDTLIKKMEKFLRSQGAEQKFGEPEPFRTQFEARFIPITDKIKALVAAGMPLYMAMLMVQNDETQ